MQPEMQSVVQRCTRRREKLHKYVSSHSRHLGNCKIRTFRTSSFLGLASTTGVEWPDQDMNKFQGSVEWKAQELLIKSCHFHHSHDLKCWNCHEISVLMSKCLWIVFVKTAAMWAEHCLNNAQCVLCAVCFPSNRTSWDIS